MTPQKQVFKAGSLKVLAVSRPKVLFHGLRGRALENNHLCPRCQVNMIEPET
jgi:hypothetical protein